FDAALRAAAHRRFDGHLFPLGLGELDPVNPSRPITSSIARTELLPVGSVMKLLTAVPMIESGAFPDGLPVRSEWNGRPNEDGACGGSIEAMLAASCNSGFSEGASIVGAIPLEDVARSAGLGDVDPDDDPVGPWLDGLDTARARDVPFTQAPFGDPPR